ncbi:MAG: hypothetical protein Q9183_003606 [Haloplaca sp. 2 TL-2023]
MQLGSRGPSILRSQTYVLGFLTPSLSQTVSGATTLPCQTYIALSKAASYKQWIDLPSCSRYASSAAAAAATAPSSEQSASDDERAPDSGPLYTPSPRSQDSQKNRHMSILGLFNKPSSPTSNEDADRVLNQGLPRAQNSNPPSSKPTHTDYENESSATYVENMRNNSYRGDFVAAQSLKQGRISRGMMLPGRQATPDPSNTEVEAHPEPTLYQPTIKSRPSLGRTVEIWPDRGFDLGRAFRSLDIMCAVNGVRSDTMKQRFHERPGLKRKRLKSVRWRRNFKKGFNEVVGKVKRMRRKGW